MDATLQTELLRWEWWLLAVCFGGAIALLVFGYLDSRQSEQIQSIRERVEALAQSTWQPDTPTQQTTRDKALQKPFVERVFFPLAQSTFDFFQSVLPMGNRSWTRQKLIQAGYAQPRYAKLFVGSQLLFASVLFGFFMVYTLLFGRIGGLLGIVVALVFGGVGYSLPLLWLTTKAKKRQKAIQKCIADFLDLLVICVEAGLGLDSALQRIADLPVDAASPELKRELRRYSMDLGLGKTRKQALTDLAQRVGLDDLSSVIHALNQAYEMGTGVTQTLRVQSEMLRVKRIQRAEEQANKIPVKMIIPIYVFLFPAIFTAMFGPLGMTMINAVQSILGNVRSLG